MSRPKTSRRNDVKAKVTGQLLSLKITKIRSEAIVVRRLALDVAVERLKHIALTKQANMASVNIRLTLKKHQLDCCLGLLWIFYDRI